jgi:hypothetical protein
VLELEWTGNRKVEASLLDNRQTRSAPLIALEGIPMGSNFLKPLDEWN